MREKYPFTKFSWGEMNVLLLCTKLNSSKIADTCWEDATRKVLEEYTRDILRSQRERFLNKMQNVELY